MLTIRQFLVCIVLFAHSPAIIAQEKLISDDEVKQILIARVADLSAGEKKVGMVIGIISPGGTRILSEGYVDENGLKKPDGNTVFEIASVTKVFSGLLLAQMVNSGEVKLDDPIAKYLPKDVTVPSGSEQQMSLLDLATHTSGLPFMPDITAESNRDLYRYLSTCRLNAEIGKAWDYSNTGYWLMSEGLSKKAGVSFEEALQKRILAPFELSSTNFSLTQAMKTNLAPGYDASLQKAPLMVDVPNYKLMPAAGLLYSSVNDLLKLLAVSMGQIKNEVSPAIQLSTSVSRSISGNKQQTLGWIILEKNNERLIYHDGISFGYASCIMFNPKSKTGVVVLSNQAADVSDIAHHILDPAFPLAHPKTEKRIKIKLNASRLSNYVGKFQTEDSEIFIVTLRDETLWLESPSDWGIPVLKIHPENDTSFYMDELPMKIVFDVTPEKESVMIYPPRRKDGISAKRVP